MINASQSSPLIVADHINFSSREIYAITCSIGEQAQGFLHSMKIEPRNVASGQLSLK